MGHTIEALGIQQGHSFPVIIDEDNLEQLNPGLLEKVDVAIEFTTPEAAPFNIKKCIGMGLPVVSGTTGWNEKIPEIEAFCRKNNGSLFYASNFSIGVNILFALNRKLAEIMDGFPEYRVSIREVHHIHKKDAPSGTAISLAQQILNTNKQLIDWTLIDHEKPDASTGRLLPIEASRMGEVKGQHTIHYESDLDSITISHDAKTREAFAAGVIPAAVYIKDRKGIFGMQDLLKL